MKRIIAIVMAVLMISALLVACGDKNDPNRTVKTTVSTKYDDGFAKSYASSVSTDSNGNTTYEFSSTKYDEFTYDYKNDLAKSIAEEVASRHESTYGEFAYINPEKTSVIIGLNPGEYDAAVCEAEAPTYAEYGFRYFKNLETPVSAIKVVFCNANDQDEVYGSFDFTAD